MSSFFSIKPLGVYLHSAFYSGSYGSTVIRYDHTTQKIDDEGCQIEERKPMEWALTGPQMADLPESWSPICEDNFERYLGDHECRDAARIAHFYFRGAKRENMLRRVLDAELNAKEFGDAVQAGSYIGDKQSFEKIVNEMKKGNLTKETLLDVEETADLFLGFFPNFRIMIFNTLISLFESLGLNDDVTRLKNKLENVKLYKNVATTGFSAYVGLWCGAIASELGAATPAAIAVGAAGAILAANPRLLRAENLLGAAAGVTAAAAGLSPVAAVGAGVYTAFMTRLPLIQEGAKLTARAGLAVGEGAVNAVTWTLDRTVNGVAIPLIKGTGKGIFSFCSGIVSGCAAVANGIDRAMDWVAK